MSKAPLTPLPGEAYACPCDRIICPAVGIPAENPSMAMIVCPIHYVHPGLPFGCGHNHILPRHIEIRLGSGEIQAAGDVKP